MSEPILKQRRIPAHTARAVAAERERGLESSACGRNWRQNVRGELSELTQKGFSFLLNSLWRPRSILHGGRPVLEEHYNVINVGEVQFTLIENPVTLALREGFRIFR